MTMMKTQTKQQRGGVAGDLRVEVHHPAARAQRADHEDEAEDQQRGGEQRADDRALGDDTLAGVQGEEHDEELRQVAERRLQEAGGRRPDVLADVSVANDTIHARPAEGDRRDQEGRQRRPAGVVRRRR